MKNRKSVFIVAFLVILCFVIGALGIIKVNSETAFSSTQESSTSTASVTEGNTSVSSSISKMNSSSSVMSSTSASSSMAMSSTKQSKESSDSQVSTVSGVIEMKLVFSASEKNDLLKSINETLTDAKTQLKSEISQTTDIAKKQIFQNAEDGINELNAEKISTVDSKGNLIINEVVPNAQVSIGDKTVNTNEKGQYVVKDVPKGTQSVIVSYNNLPINAAQVNVSKNEKVNISSTATQSQINQNMAKSENTATAQSVRTFQGIVTKKSGKPYNGLGRMHLTNKIRRNGRLVPMAVTCNEAGYDRKANTSNFDAADTDLNKFSYLGNNSDCARSTKMGITILAGLANPAAPAKLAALGLLIPYNQSVACALEAGTHASNSALALINKKFGGTFTNIYCNGNHTGMYWNCSAFFINNSINPQKIQTLHTYK